MNRNKSSGNANGNSNGNGNGNSMKNMKGGAAAAPVVNYNAIAPNNILNERLFQIVSDGINDIVSQIKQKLGHDITTTNKNAKNIMEMFNNLERYVRTEALTINNENGEDFNNSTLSIARDMNENYYQYSAHNNYYNNVKDIANIITNAQTLNRQIISEQEPERYVNTDKLQDDNNINVDQNRIKIIENRLKNCQNLEVLYLIKHKELMTTFAFTLNLFDKYKYAVKIILFLLKNLVNKTLPPGTPPPPPPPPGTLSIRIPKPLIKNIGALVKDQQKVQGIIDTMKKTLINSQVDAHVATDGDTLIRARNLTKSPPPPVETNNINTRLVNPPLLNPNESPLQRE